MGRFKAISIFFSQWPRLTTWRWSSSFLCLCWPRLAPSSLSINVKQVLALVWRRFNLRAFEGKPLLGFCTGLQSHHRATSSRHIFMSHFPSLASAKHNSTTPIMVDFIVSLQALLLPLRMPTLRQPCFLEQPQRFSESCWSQCPLRRHLVEVVIGF